VANSAVSRRTVFRFGELSTKERVSEHAQPQRVALLPDRLVRTRTSLPR
jgi:hypothetical protein